MLWVVLLRVIVVSVSMSWQVRQRGLLQGNSPSGLRIRVGSLLRTRIFLRLGGCLTARIGGDGRTWDR
jgi:hypothetical protein